MRLELLYNDAVDFWRYPVFKYKIDGFAMVAPTHFKWFEERLTTIGVKKEIIIENVFQ